MSIFLITEISWEALPLVTSFSKMIKIYNSEQKYTHFSLEMCGHYTFGKLSTFLKYKNILYV